MNTKNSERLEEKVWYRIAKVFYGIGCILVISLGLLTIFLLQPNTYIDTDKSYITCLDGAKYNLNQIGYDSIQMTLTSEGDKQARIVCMKRQAYPELTKRRAEKAKAAGWTDDEINRAIYLDAMKANPSDLYKVSFVESTSGSWNNAILWGIAILIGGFIILEVLQKTVLYILTGKNPISLSVK